MCKASEIEDSVRNWLLDELLNHSSELSHLRLKPSSVVVRKSDGQESVGTGSEICVWFYDERDPSEVVDILEWHITGRLAIGSTLDEIKLELSNTLKEIMKDRRFKLSEL